MAFASRALLLARFRTLPANNGVVRPLAAAGSLFLLPAGTTAKAVAMCLAARRATSSYSSSLRESSRRLSSSRPPKETVAGDGTDSDSGSDCDDDSEETDLEDERSDAENTTSDSDSDVEKKTSHGGSSSHKTFSGWPPKKLPLVVMDPPPGDPSNPDVSRDELIDTYVDLGLGWV
nr:unnamed protein product [Digitaria exilis]